MQCDVTDLKGNHCPEEAVHTVVFKGVETHLCERCHANVLAGAYGRHLTQRAADGSAALPDCLSDATGIIPHIESGGTLRRR